MSTWKILIMTAVVLVAICKTQDIQITSRPIRPDIFDNGDSVKNYVEKIKFFYTKMHGNRFGKRFLQSMKMSNNNNNAKTQDWRSKMFETFVAI